MGKLDVGDAFNVGLTRRRSLIRHSSRRCRARPCLWNYAELPCIPNWFILAAKRKNIIGMAWQFAALLPVQYDDVLLRRLNKKWFMVS